MHHRQYRPRRRRAKSTHPPRAKNPRATSAKKMYESGANREIEHETKNQIFHSDHSHLGLFRFYFDFLEFHHHDGVIIFLLPV